MRRFLIVAATAVLTALPQAMVAESLTDALIAAYRNSHLLDQNQAVLRAADEDLAAAVASLRPVLSFRNTISVTHNQPTLFGGVNSNVETSDTAALIGSLPIYDFGRGKATINLRNELVKATQKSLVSVEQQVLLDAVSAYVNMGLQTELVAAQESNVRLITQDLRAAQDRFEVGEVTRTDVAMAEAQLAASQAGLAATQGSYNVARERYKAVTGHYPGTLSGLPAWPGRVKTLDEARAIALASHPAILQAQHQARAADFGVELARSQFRPNIDGRLTMSTTIDDGDASPVASSLSINFDQTLYAGGQLASALRKAIAQSQSAQAGLRATAVNVEEAVGRAWSNILVANVSIQAGDQQIAAAQAAYDGVKQEAELGSRTTLDVLDAEQTLLQAKAARLQAAANLYVSQYQLLSAMGQLTVARLNLGIPTFDPEAYLNAVKGAPVHSAQGKKLDRILKSLGK